MKKAYIIAAQRTAVVPRGGMFRMLEVADLVAPLIIGILKQCEIAPADIDNLFLGNALYGGGNPARVASLMAGLPEATPSMTIDIQCCSGMDAIGLAVQQIQAGKAEIILAGGAESFSRSPIRQKRPMDKNGTAVSYDRPPFTPWSERDPDMLQAAATLAEKNKISRLDQEDFAIESHKKAREKLSSQISEILPIGNVDKDAFTRELSGNFCKRLKPVSGSFNTALTAATVAVEADAAALVLVVSEEKLKKLEVKGRAVEVIDTISLGGDPTKPALVPIDATYEICKRQKMGPSDLHVIEIMEAFAVQAMSFIHEFGFDPEIVNRGGGALARGHPIGASGAINIVRLWHELQKEPEESVGLAAIAAAGGLGSAFLGRVC